MSELQDEIQNLSAVLELLQIEARGVQRPVLRLASSHLRLLARNLSLYDDRAGGLPPARGGAALPPPSRARSAMCPSKAASNADRTGCKGRPPLPRGRDSWGHALRLAREERDWEELLPYLPDNVRQLWNALRDARLLWRVLQAYGGRNVRVPRLEPDANNPLRRRLGLRCVRRLMAVFGGTFVYVPRCSALREKLRQREIIEAFGRHTAHGLSSTAAVAALALRHDLSDRRIWQILKKDASAPAQARVLRRLGDSAALSDAGKGRKNTFNME
ncbi:Mor transcription activator family protein [Desulfovibrio sp. SGI.169]|uniref:Mor transcription activator family protein n=1 Tax=Desulfovibrio sp. SGI.169 TaxID=3420561 RepID=UPI003D01D077